ncbi:Photosystem I assembly protein Ycf3 [uncultured archaeon]|nr:Photosystem I assembly protein Ycf3 [uncultured archaeon]
MTDTNYKYDIYLSYSRPDVDSVEKVARYLSDIGLKVWFDRWSLVPGVSWQVTLEEALGSSFTIAVFIGTSPLSNWQKQEWKTSLIKQKSDSLRRIMTVLLPGSTSKSVPSHLRKLTHIDLRKGLENTYELNRIIVNIGHMYGDRGELDKAIEYFEMALEIAEELKDIRGKAARLNNIGSVYQDWGKPEQALEYYQKALEIDEELKDIQ